ncbi:translation elongation factor Ts [Sinimarinibacterium flocculans]|uniref:Elongation factor Ts n=1 Tax=Sinimarinibacterium flocculans TaxID=985250 RepID=A0A318EA50_9GAMM|nr:translation elongation factor Ts [Sinimarinibacterium flocculans]PXV68436.1 translation elongation factor Ts (EF-Ts) [Sinimarinibacterium flocculans]
MAQITAALVKELRDRTGAGMGDCKKALEATGGDINAAVEKLRMDGAAKADKKASRTAAEGVLAFAVAADAVAVAELNCETDFVAKGDEFRDLAKRSAEAALKHRPANIEALVQIKDGAETLDETRRAMVGRIGENMTIRRFEVVAKAGGPLVTYMHPGDKIGVIVSMEAGDEVTGKDVAMHIAAMSPRFLDAASFSAEAIEAERRIIEATVAQEQAEAKAESEKLAGVLKEMDAEKQNGVYEGLSEEDRKRWDDDYATIKKKFGGGFKPKPAEILAKMIDGKVKKFIAENTLMGQTFVKSSDQTVEQMLKEKGAKVARFVRFAVGEGIEKQQTDFAAEVMAQAGIKS